MVFSVSYDSDLTKAKKVLTDLLAEEESVLSEPPPQVFVQKLGDSSIDIAIWPFVQIADYLVFQTTISERVKDAFDEADIHIPYPKQDIHLIAGKEQV